MNANDTTVETKIPLGQLLIQKGVVSREQVQKALAEQKRRGYQALLGELLVEMNLATEEQILSALADAYGLPYVKVSPKLVDPEAVALLPTDFCRRQNVLPMFKVFQTLTIAMHEPTNVFLIEQIQDMTGCKVQVVAASSRDIAATLDSYSAESQVFVLDELEEIQLEDVGSEAVGPTDIADLEAAAGDSPVIRLVNQLIYNAVREGASDIHVEPDDGLLRVRYRLDGRLYERLRPPLRMHPAIVSRIKIMSQLDISERRLPQDGAIHVLMDGRPIDLRVSTMPGKFGEKIVIRIIDNKKILVDIEQLGFSPEVLSQFRQAIHRPNGIVLVTGPTGSGKSTTLYAVLQEINNDEINICTVEDPIEFNLKGVNQFQVNEKAGFTFATALRTLLRQDPDVMMIGEIRDEATSKIAVQAALTGHMVLSTMHTNDAPGAITRLFNIGVEPYLIGATLAASLAQRLVRKICPNCKQPYDPPTAVKKAVQREVGEVEQYWRGSGCGKCRNTGYAGRIGIFELLVPDDNYRQAICDGATIGQLHELAEQLGMVRLRTDGRRKVREGITTPEEVLRVTT